MTRAVKPPRFTRCGRRRAWPALRKGGGCAPHRPVGRGADGATGQRGNGAGEPRNAERGHEAAVTAFPAAHCEVPFRSANAAGLASQSCHLPARRPRASHLAPSLFVKQCRAPAGQETVLGSCLLSGHRGSAGGDRRLPVGGRGCVALTPDATSRRVARADGASLVPSASGRAARRKGCCFTDKCPAGELAQESGPGEQVAPAGSGQSRTALGPSWVLGAAARPARPPPHRPSAGRRAHPRLSSPAVSFHTAAGVSRGDGGCVEQHPRSELG